MNVMKWLCIGLLAAGCAWTAGCGGGDGEAGTAAPAEPDPEEPAPGGTVALVAPQLVSPPDGQIYFDMGEDGIYVKLDWTSVPGAASYTLQVRDPSLVWHTVTNTHSGIKWDFIIGKWRWQVWAVDAGGTAGPKSPSSGFEVRKMPIQKP